MNDLDIRHAVQAAGEDISPAFRRELADTLRAEAAGERTVALASVTSLDAARRRRIGLWGGIGLVGLAAATVTALVITRDEQAGVVVTDTGPDATTSVTSPEVSTATTPTTAGPAPTGTDPAVLVPSVPLVAATAPGATSQGSTVVSPDSAKQPLTTVFLADLDVEPVPADHPELAPAVSFLPDGDLLVLDVQAATAQVVSPAGEVRWTTSIPATLDEVPATQSTLARNTPWQAALGPDDVLYVSYVIGDPSAPDGFALAAIAIAGERAGTVVQQWATDWECVEGTCGEVTLAADGVRLLWSDGGTTPYIDSTGAPSGSTYDVSTIDQAMTGTDVALPDGYVDSAGYGAYGAGGYDVGLGGDRWHLDALGVQFIEGSFTYATEQPDGSALAWVSTTKDSALSGVTTLVRMLPGGAIEQYLPPQLAYVDVTSIGGILYGVRPFALDGGATGYQLEGLVPDGDTTSGTVDTVVPTTNPATDSGLPPAVASLPTSDQELAGGRDLLAGGVSGVGLTAVQALRADGSGDVFATRPALDDNGVLVLVHSDGTVADLGIPVGMRGGVVSSNDDRLYVWDRTSFSGDDQSVTWTVYEPTGVDSWAPSGSSSLQVSAGECTFYVSGEGCRSAAQAAPLVPGDSVDWAVASQDLATLTVSLGGAATTRELVEPDLDTTVCFDVDCSFQFAPAADGLVLGWHQVANADGTTRTAVIAMHPDGSSGATWLPGSNWYVAGVSGATVVAWHLDAAGSVDSITAWPIVIS